VAAGRIFIDLGKLYTGIEAGLAKGEQIFPLLIKSGVRKGSVSNASQTSRVFKEMVVTKAISEAAFDAFRWGDICAMNRVMSGASKKKLTAAETAKIIADSPKRFDEELESIFVTGCTMAEADKLAEAEDKAAKKAAAEQKAAEKKAADDKAAAEQQAAANKAVADALAAKAAKEQEKADKAAAAAKVLQDKAAADAAAAKTATEKKAAAKAAEDAEKAAAKAKTLQDKAKADADDAVKNAAEAKAAAEAAAKITGPTEPSTPSNITQMPPQAKAKPTASDLGTQLDKLLEAVTEASAADQQVFITTCWTAADSLLRALVVAPKAKTKAA
jgi:hypothetical protein